MLILIFPSVVLPLTRCSVTVHSILYIRCTNAAIRIKHSVRNNISIKLCIFGDNYEYFLPSPNPPDVCRRFRNVDLGIYVWIYNVLIYLYCGKYSVNLESNKLKMEASLNGVSGRATGCYARPPTNSLSTGIFQVFKTTYTSPTRR